MQLSLVALFVVVLGVIASFVFLGHRKTFTNLFFIIIFSVLIIIAMIFEIIRLVLNFMRCQPKKSNLPRVNISEL
eukprot:UN01497